MSTDAGQALVDQLRAAVKEQTVIIEVGTGILFTPGTGDLNSRPTLHLFKPGATPRSKRVKLLPVLVGDGETQKASDMLRIVAEVMAEEGL